MEQMFTSYEQLLTNKFAVVGLILASLWSLVFKGFALYKAARRGDLGWFASLLVISTLGILDILYLFVFSKPKGFLKDHHDTTSGELSV